MSTRVLRPRKAKSLAGAPASAVSRKRKATVAQQVAEATSSPPPFGMFEMQGRREYMEDRVLVAAPLQLGSMYHFYGVYDGHGGAEASQYCKDKMAQAFAEHLAKPRSSVPKALRGAYAQIDSEFCTIANSSNGKIESGTTAVSVVVGAKEFWVANTGDSRAMLVKANGEAAALTVDHSPESKKEAARIRRAGGFISNDDGCHRVGGLLAVSRAIGDAYLKPMVISDPDVKRHVRRADQAFLVLGSDGLWDELLPSDVADALGLSAGSENKVPATPLQIATCAQKLVKAAFQAGSEDNICCLIVDLRDSPAPAGEEVDPKIAQAVEADGPPCLPRTPSISPLKLRR